MLMREWAARTYPGVPLLEQLRLGPTSAKLIGVVVTPALEAALRVANWFADGVLLSPMETLVIEAKVRPTPAAVSQVQFYAEQIASTPALASRLSLPINALVLFAEDDPVVNAFARRHGVRVAIYTPPWIADYLQLVQFRQRAASPSKPPEASSEDASSPAA
jgi:hypothetical protein